jgi:hypothetical protein
MNEVEAAKKEFALDNSVLLPDFLHVSRCDYLKNVCDIAIKKSFYHLS